MSNDQVFRLLTSLGVAGVARNSRNGVLTMVFDREQGVEELLVTDYKKLHISALRELEERRKEILENRFTSPVMSEVDVLGGRRIPVSYWKSDRQLSEEELEQKQELLREVDRELRHHQTVIAGMNYLQAHAREMLPRLLLSPARLVRRQGDRIVWTRGTKSAALHCLQQMDRDGVSDLEACTRFLSQYVIKGDEEYTPERLLNNVRQIRQLDRTR